MEEENVKLDKRRAIRKKISPLAYIILSFLSVILVGSLLLFLPISASDSDHRLSYINAFFIAVSGVCVTGLSPIADLSVTFSVFGKVILAILIQIGGLGLVTIVSFVMFASGKRFNVSQAMVVKEALNQNGFAGLKKMIFHIIIITASFEVVGTIMNLFVFTKDYPFWEALGISVFHAISSFNNAGFDIIGSTSMIKYADNFLLNFSTCFLIIGGGLGFLVFEDIFTFHKWRNFSIQTKIVLLVNLFLLVLPPILFKAFEWNDITFMQAFFYSVNLRTAGFTTFDLTKLSGASVALSVILMFIGGSPLSTAGGIKTTTLFVLLSSMVSFSRGKRTVVFKREIDHYTKLKAYILMFLGIFEIFLGSILISLFEKDGVELDKIVFEATSAFGTVGFTIGVTPGLSVGSKIVLCFLMFSGRVGPVLLLAIWNPTLFKPKRSEVRYLDTDVIVG